MAKLFLIAALLGVVLMITQTEGHGTLRKPPQRSSVWRDPNFEGQVPPNYDDGGLWCGGVKQDYQPKDCGTCGDPSFLVRPRPNENGGMYGTGLIVANYTKGQVIDITFELTASHDGYFSVQICDSVTDETEDCFFKRPFLQLGTGSDQYDCNAEDPILDAPNLNYIPINEKLVGHPMGEAKTTATLPDDLTCSHCVLRLYYRAFKDWAECDGICECTPPGAIGCGMQEIVLNCADVSIN